MLVNLSIIERVQWTLSIIKFSSKGRYFQAKYLRSNAPKPFLVMCVCLIRIFKLHLYGPISYSIAVISNGFSIGLFKAENFIFIKNFRRDSNPQPSRRGRGKCLSDKHLQRIDSPEKNLINFSFPPKNSPRIPQQIGFKNGTIQAERRLLFTVRANWWRKTLSPPETFPRWSDK